MARHRGEQEHRLVDGDSDEHGENQGVVGVHRDVGEAHDERDEDELGAERNDGDDDRTPAAEHGA